MNMGETKQSITKPGAHFVGYEVFTCQMEGPLQVHMSAY